MQSCPVPAFATRARPLASTAMEVGALTAPDAVSGLEPLGVPLLPSSVMELPLRLAIQALPAESLAMAMGVARPPPVNAVDPERTAALCMESSTTLLAPVLAIQTFAAAVESRCRAGRAMVALPVKLVVVQGCWRGGP